MKKKGTTLVELIAVIAIMSVVVIAMYNIFDVANKIYYKNRLHSMIQLAANNSINSIYSNIHKCKAIVYQPTACPITLPGGENSYLCYLTVRANSGDQHYLYCLSDLDGKGT